MATEERVMRISHLRGSLGWAYTLVRETDEPILIQRYGTKDCILAPAWQWKFFQELEAAIRAGKRPWEDGSLDEFVGTVAEPDNFADPRKLVSEQLPQKSSEALEFEVVRFLTTCRRT